MYKEILEMPFTAAKANLSGIEAVDSARKIITLRGDKAGVEVFGEDSDIIIYYDIIKDSEPLLLVERIQNKAIELAKVKAAVKVLQKEVDDYVPSCVVSSDKKFIDIILVRRNIHDKLRGAGDA